MNSILRDPKNPRVLAQGLMVISISSEIDLEDKSSFQSCPQARWPTWWICPRTRDAQAVFNFLCSSLNPLHLASLCSAGSRVHRQNSEASWSLSYRAGGDTSGASFWPSLGAPGSSNPVGYRTFECLNVEMHLLRKVSPAGPFLIDNMIFRNPFSLCKYLARLLESKLGSKSKRCLSPLIHVFGDNIHKMGLSMRCCWRIKSLSQG